MPNNYGSYAMGTGIRPLPGKEYDVDVGLIFNLRPDSVSPVIIKGAVFEALNGYQPLWQRPCLTVVRPGFHLDLSVCAKEGDRLSHEQIRQLRDRFTLLLQRLEEAQRHNTLAPLGQAFGAGFLAPAAPPPVSSYGGDYHYGEDYGYDDD